MKWISIDYDSIDSLITLLKELRVNNVPENEKWLYVNRYQDHKARKNGIPLSGQFELTPLCNLDCKMCYVHLNKERVEDHQLLNTEQWKNIMLQAHKMGMRHACLTGGECLSYPGFEDLYLYLLSIGVSVSIKTNGVLINEERLKFFEKYPPRELCISLYGSSEEAYEKVTGYRVFQIVDNNLKKLQKVKYPVSISITPNKYMIDDIEPLLKYAQSLGITYNINYGLFPPRDNTGRDLNDMSIQNYVDMILLYKKLNGDYTYSNDILELPDANRSSKKKRFGIECAAGRSSFSVLWDGTLCACTSLTNIGKSLLSNSFKDAWIHINAIANNYPLPSECPDCPYYPVCMQCIAFHNDLNNPGKCNPYICKKTKAYVEAGIAKL